VPGGSPNPSLTPQEQSDRIAELALSAALRLATDENRLAEIKKNCCSDRTFSVLASRDFER
jgi:hypothetical protein